MVDAIVPESEVALRFSQGVDQFIRSNFQDEKSKSDSHASLVSRLCDLSSEASISDRYVGRMKLTVAIGA